jgi:lipid A 3-O-deacylase
MISPLQKTFLFILCVFSISSFAQKENKIYLHQLLLISENDSYTLKIIDRYYTNGISVRYSKALPASGKKKLFNAEIGQNIYTAYDVRKSSYADNLDRPYTGFLFLKSGLSYLYKNENVLRWNGIIGVTGEAAQGEEIQRIIHQVLGFKPAYGWEAQLKSEFSINAEASYYQHLTKPKEKKSFDAFFVSNATIGTTFTKFSAGTLFRLGAIEPSYKSAWWDGRISNSIDNSPGRHHEFFFYFEPSVVAQVFNATVQEGLFTDQQGRFTSKIQPFIYQHKFGGMYARNKWTAQLGYTYRTKEAKTMKGKEVYGTIAIGYRF